MTDSVTLYPKRYFFCDFTCFLGPVPQCLKKKKIFFLLLFLFIFALCVCVFCYCSVAVFWRGEGGGSPPFFFSALFLSLENDFNIFFRAIMKKILFHWPVRLPSSSLIYYYYYYFGTETCRGWIEYFLKVQHITEAELIYSTVCVFMRS